MIDLKQFCGTELTRYYLNEPWTRDGFTYATNGHILVRVPARHDIEDQPKAPDITKMPWPNGVVEFIDAPRMVLPPVSLRKCEECGGRRFEHECPDCECACELCACELCDGTGEVSSDDKTSIDFNGNLFALRYIRQLMKLQRLTIGSGEYQASPMPFKFKGGEGLLMPLRKKFRRHVLPDGSDEPQVDRS